MMGRGALNGWRCDDCGEVTYAVHVHEGVTPMFLGCRATDGCKGRGTSLMYPSEPPHNRPVPEHVLEAVAWEWYAPTAGKRKRLKRSDPAMFDHVEKGGLMLRRLTDEGRAALDQRVAA